MDDLVVTWTPFALRCLADIRSYIEAESGSTSPADKFIERIFERIDQLRNHPHSGQSEQVLVSRGIEARYLVESSYKIVYMKWW
jgi:plasmid stabilization system protein ParE